MPISTPFKLAALGEAILIASSIAVAIQISRQSVALSTSMILVQAARCLLIWAWCRRLPNSDAFFLAWTIPMLLQELFVATQFTSFVSKHGLNISHGQIATGDSSIATWGAALLLVTVLTRTIELGTLVFFRQISLASDIWPSKVLAGITAFWVGMHLVNALAIPGRLMGFLLWAPRFGFQVYL